MIPQEHMFLLLVRVFKLIEILLLNEYSRLAILE